MAPTKQTSVAGGDGEQRFTIGELAEQFGITTRTIRFYEARGLVVPERRGTARYYSRRDRARIAIVLRGRNLGFSLEDIKEYLALYDADPAHLGQLKHLKSKLDAHIGVLESKRADLDRTLSELAKIREQVANALARSGG